MALEDLHSPTEPTTQQIFDSWTKRKRTKRELPPPSPMAAATQPNEDESLALCLMMLARSGSDDTTTPVSASVAEKNTNVEAKKQTEVIQIVEAKKANINEVKKMVAFYKCALCEKSFSTYQALGGHKASHGNKLATIKEHKNNPLSSPTSTSTTSPSKATICKNNILALNPTGRIHECSICHKTFPTGQALGGHKRRHYEGNLGGGGGAKTTTTTSAEGGAASTIETKRQLDFDLNYSPASSELDCLDLSVNDEVESLIKKPRFSIPLILNN